MKNLFKSQPYDKEFVICGHKHKALPKSYINEVIGYSDGFMKAYLKSFLKESGHSLSDNKTIYMPEFAVDTAIEEIEYFKKTGKWRKIEKQK